MVYNSRALITAFGSYCLALVSPETTVSSFKLMIEAKWKINQNQQTLVMKGKPLEDENTISQYGLSEGDKIFLTVKKSSSHTEPTSPSFISQMLSSMRPLGSPPQVAQSADFWEKLDPLLHKHFTREDAVRVKEYYRKYLKQCVASLSLDDIDRLASLGLQREKYSQAR